MANEAVTKETMEAGQQIRDVLESHFETDSRMHVGTVVAAAARQAGTTVMRSMNLPLGGLKPGAVVLSNQANEQGPKSMELAQALLNANSILAKENEGQGFRPWYAWSLFAHFDFRLT